MLCTCVADPWEAVEAERAKWEAQESKYEARENRLMEEITALQAQKEECSTEATNQRCKRETADKDWPHYKHSWQLAGRK